MSFCNLVNVVPTAEDIQVFQCFSEMNVHDVHDMHDMHVGLSSWEPKREPSPSLSSVFSHQLSVLSSSLHQISQNRAEPWAGWSKRGSDSPHMVRKLETCATNSKHMSLQVTSVRSFLISVWKRFCPCCVFVLFAAIAWSACRMWQMIQGSWTWRINLANFKQNSRRVHWQPQPKYPCKWHRIKRYVMAILKCFGYFNNTTKHNQQKNGWIFDGKNSGFLEKHDSTIQIGVSVSDGNGCDCFFAVGFRHGLEFFSVCAWKKTEPETSNVFFVLQLVRTKSRIAN